MAPITPPIRRVVFGAVMLVILGTVVVTAPSAGAKECGKQVIDQYFDTGKITYHSQACYASALKQIDPDARMYSGIMAAVRASRARDKAADEKPAAQQNETPAGKNDKAAGVIATEPIASGEEVVPLPPTEQDSLARAMRAVKVDNAATSEQAAGAAMNAEDHVPLVVLLLGGLAALLTLVGLGGLTARWLD